MARDSFNVKRGRKGIENNSGSLEKWLVQVWGTESERWSFCCDWNKEVTKDWDVTKQHEVAPSGYTGKYAFCKRV